METKRPRGRPRKDEPRTRCGFQFRQETIDSLALLVKRHKDYLPPLIQLSQTMILEALIDYAVRTELSFADLFQAPATIGEE